jgi:large subunit ribosomal protein L44e
MKVPKKTNRFCPYCKKKTNHKIELVSTGGKRGAMKRGGRSRIEKRGKWRGLGSLGRYSKPPAKSYKRKTKSTTKKLLIYTCSECKKAHQMKKGIRVSRLQIEERIGGKKK